MDAYCSIDIRGPERQYHPARSGEDVQLGMARARLDAPGLERGIAASRSWCRAPRPVDIPHAPDYVVFQLVPRGDWLACKGCSETWRAESSADAGTKIVGAPCMLTSLT
jgi:hypothetical protein